jgi:DNA primase
MELAPKKVDQNSRSHQEPLQPERPAGPRSFKRQIEAVKNGVRIEQEARTRSELKLLGNGRLLGNCVSPTHDDQTPSMTIYTETQTFKCYGIGCGAQGDILDFVMLAEPGMELWEAMIFLSTRYGIALPERPRSWFAKQERQQPVRNAIAESIVHAARRRLYHRFFEPLVLATTDEEIRVHDAQCFWEATEPLAKLLIANMMECQR